MRQRIFKLKGGLGNQLFQYAHGRKLSIIDKKEVIFNTSFFEQNTTDTPRLFLLEKFNISDSIFFINKENIWYDFLKKIYSKINNKDDVFFQSEKYFKDIEHIIRKEFTLKSSFAITAQEFKKKITDSLNPVSLHVRRGDYVLNPQTNQYHGTCGIDYYEKAIQYIKEKVDSPSFFIFSDDIEWVKENLQIQNATYVSNPNLTECEELILMSKCSNHIIANSSFSWWSAWLNPNSDKIVIAPSQWTTTQTSNDLDILPTSWIQI